MKWRRPLPLVRNLNAMARRKVELLYFAHKGNASSVKLGNEDGHGLLSFRAAKKEKDLSSVFCRRAAAEEEAALNGSRSQRDEPRRVLSSVSCSIFMGIRWGDLYSRNESRVKRFKFSNDHYAIIVESWIRFVISWNSIIYARTQKCDNFRKYFFNQYLCKKQMLIIVLFSQLYSVKVFYNNDQTEQIL